MKIKKIISGGQTGADIAAIDAAIEFGFPYGGWLPKGRRTENGPLNTRYKLQEMTSASFPKRTEQNVKDSDGTVIFTHGKLSGGSSLTKKYAVRHNKPLLHLNMDIISEQKAFELLRNFIDEYKIEILNVAGSRASKDDQIYDGVFSIIRNIIRNIE